MAINKKLVHFKTFAKFNEELSAGNILDTSICWIKDTKQIWTHGQFYDCSSLTDEDIVKTVLVGYTESVETNENLDLTAEDTIVGAFGKLVKAIKDNEEVDSAAFVKLRDSIGLDENLGFSTSAGDASVTEAIERIDGKIISTGDGTKFLADNGQYKEVGAASVTDERIVGSAIVGYTESVETGAGLDLAQDDTIIEAFGKLSKSIKDNKSDASSTFATKEELNAKADSTAIADMATKTWVGQQGYLTEHQDISGLATKSELTSGLSGKQDKGDYALKSEIPDVSSFITKDVSDLTNYYKKSDIESKLSGKSDTSHTHANATQSVNGFMSSTDKAKLDGVALNANNYTHPTTSGNKHIPSGGSSGQILRWAADGTAAWGNDNNTTYGQATASELGLVKVGYIENGKNYPVELSNGQMFVNVPWTDTTYSLSSFDVIASATELNYCKGVTSAIQTQLNAKLDSDYYTGHSTTTSYTIPTNKRLCIATLSSSGSLSVGLISDGRELHIIVKNGGSSKITITFPSSGYVKLSGDTLDIEAGAYAEINIISDGTTKYIRAA